MVCESYISNQLLSFPEQKLNSIKETMVTIYGKTMLLKKDFSYIIDLLKHDKKNVNGQVNFVLLEDYEVYQLDCKVPESLVLESLNFYNS
jgi:3-dehydroquinate synthase